MDSAAAFEIMNRPMPAVASETSTERGPTVLIVDDWESGRLVIADLLQSAGIAEKTVLAEDGLQALRVLHTTPVDIVVCDLHMPHCDGIGFLRLKAADPRLQGIPVIMLTGAEDVGRKVEALSCGASDYVTKPCELTELAARITVHVKLRQLQIKLQEANAKLERLTRTDPLTQVENRRHFDTMLEEEFLRARRYERPLSLCMLDLDHFKRLNDAHGHQAGDAALVAVADRCKRSLRRCDTVARYGGEEFALILPETPAEGARLAVDRLRESIANEPIHHGQTVLHVTASIGVATFPHELVTKPQELLALADAALYDAKRLGRNRVTLAL